MVVGYASSKTKDLVAGLICGRHQAMLVPMDQDQRTPLVIVGGGAAGLMAACYAGDLGLKAVLLERKHRVGSKLLMCGNGRCNLTSALPVAELLAATALTTPSLKAMLLTY